MFTRRSIKVIDSYADEDKVEVLLRDLLTLRKTAMAALVSTALALALPTFMADLLVAIGAGLVAAACLWAQKWAPKGWAWLLLVAVAETLGGFVGVSRLLNGGTSSYLLIALCAAASVCFVSGALAQMKCRRPEGYSDGIIDGCAALAGVGVVAAQWAAFADDATPMSVGSAALSVVGFFIFLVVLRLNLGLARDKRQNRWIGAAIGLSALSIVTAMIGNGVWFADPLPSWTYAGVFMHLWLLGAAVLHRDFAKRFLPEETQRPGLMRWLGPALALTTTPVMFVMFVVADEVPSPGVGVACIALTGVALWRGARVLREREASRRELKAEQRFRSLVEHASDVITIVGDDERIMFVSGGVQELLGVTAEAVVGSRLVDFVDPADAGSVSAVLRTDLRAGEARLLQKDVRLVRPDGDERWVTVSVTDHRNTPSIDGWVLNVHDVTERKQAEQALSQMALHDPLTGLPNRTQMRSRLEMAAAAAPGRVAVLFCDLDGFKAVNDIFGHEMGDELLKGVAERWQGQLRSNDLLGRWGGDEFLVICPDVPDIGRAAQIAERLIAALSDPVELTDGTAQVGCSIGLAFHDGTEAVDALIGRADSAMYSAKRVEGGLRVA